MTGQQLFHAYVKACLCTSSTYTWDHLSDEFQRRWGVFADELSKPIDMVLYCPRCRTQHIDAPEESIEGAIRGGELFWDNPPHRSHLCHSCGFVWRPADVPTNGVKAVKTTGKKDYPVEPLPPLPLVQCSHPGSYLAHRTRHDGTPFDHCTACGKDMLA